MNDMTKNVLAVWKRADDSDLTHGREWYRTANTWCHGAAEKYGTTARSAAGIVAALSPNTGWADNIRRADVCLATGDVGHFPDCRKKALAILAGADPADVLRGSKVLSFFDNLADPENSDAVAVDRHAFDIAMGERTDDRARKALNRKGVYEMVADAYRAAAGRVKVRPHVMQSVTWETWRRTTLAGTSHAFQVEAGRNILFPA